MGNISHQADKKCQANPPKLLPFRVSCQRHPKFHKDRDAVAHTRSAPATATLSVTHKQIEAESEELEKVRPERFELPTF